jgi:hypothetical protein
LVPSTNLFNPCVSVPDPTKIKHLFGWRQVTQAPRREVVGFPSEVLTPGARTYAPSMRDIATIDSELRLVAAFGRAARERGRPLPSIHVADALLDERLRAHRVGLTLGYF